MPGLGAMPICGMPGAIIPGLGAMGGIPMGGIPIGGMPIGGIPIGIPLGIPFGIPCGTFALLPVTGALAITCPVIRLEPGPPRPRTGPARP